MSKRQPRRSSKPSAQLRATLVADIRTLIDAARDHAARTVNSTLVALYWNIGKRIREDVLRNARAGYGEQVLATLSRTLSYEYGKGFDRRNLWYMTRFAEVFPEYQIVNALRSQLSWTHFRELLSIDDPLKRSFYAELCRIECWSTRTLRQKIATLVYERTAIAKQLPNAITSELAELRAGDKMTPDLVFRDPYFLDFLGLDAHFSESELEQAILRELESFILELGTDFAFVARQKKMTVDGEDYFLDLLFFHRRLRRLVAIDLKIGKFQAADKGQMELYLRWLEEYEQQRGEGKPLGLILCADKADEHVALLRLEESGIRVARYMAALPPREVLERKLHDSIRLARERLSQQSSTANRRSSRRESLV